MTELPTTSSNSWRLYGWLSLFIAIFIWSAIDPADRFTWVLEVCPAVIALILLGATRQRFPLTTLAYTLILIHATILMVGGKYTYAQVPLFDWISTLLGQSRNQYDKLGHLAQGFIPAIIARELLVRHSVVKNARWLFFIVVCICLAISACYEIIEWWMALATGDAAEDFLGTQGYIWDTQSDMMMAFIGAILGLTILTHWHDKQLKKIK